MAFCSPEEAVEVAGAVVKAFRDTGNRSDRKLARLKYVIANQGLDFFRSKVEEHLGRKLAEARDVEITGVDDHMGWHEQGDGNLFLGVNIENGRIKDDGSLRIKSGLRAILGKYGMNTRLTALQGVILCDIKPQDRADISRMLADHGMAAAEDLTLIRRYSIACPALPTCHLSITESERVMPRVIDDLEVELRRLDLIGERISVHMTGCPNGCARPYTPDIGLVGKSRGKYTVYLGGNAEEPDWPSSSETKSRWKKSHNRYHRSYPTSKRSDRSRSRSVIFVTERVWPICKCGADRIERRGCRKFARFTFDRGFFAYVGYSSS